MKLLNQTPAGLKFLTSNIHFSFFQFSYVHVHIVGTYPCIILLMKGSCMYILWWLFVSNKNTCKTHIVFWPGINTAGGRWLEIIKLFLYIHITCTHNVQLCMFVLVEQSSICRFTYMYISKVKTDNKSNLGKLRIRQ